MIPIGPIILAARLASGAGRGQVRQSSPKATNIGARLFLGLMGVVICSMISEVGGRWGTVAWGLCGAAMFPSILLRFVFVPLGLPRVAYWFPVLTVPLAHSGEIRGGAALMAALALTRRRNLQARSAEWLDRELSLMSQSQCMAATAAGVLAAARGKRETARRIFGAVDVVSDRAPRVARRVAREWLVADAAERGAWEEVVLLGQSGFKQIGWPRTMGALARRLLGLPNAASSGVLVVAWLASRHRLATLPIVRRAIATPRRSSLAPEAPTPSLASPHGDALTPALQAHAAALRAPSEASVIAAGRAWDAVRTSGYVAALFARRAIALETRATAENALVRLVDVAERDLAPIVAGLAPSVLEASPTLAAASRVSRRKVMLEIESIAGAMAQRTARKEPLHTSGEWMEWGALRRACELALREAAPEVRRTVFAAVYGPACNHAVWLFNAQGEKLLANGMFRWLAREAKAVNDATALKLLEKNVKIGDGVR